MSSCRSIIISRLPAVARGLVPRSGGVAQCQGRWIPANAGMTAPGPAKSFVPGNWLEPIPTSFAYSPVVARGLVPRSGGVAQCQGRWIPANAGMTAPGPAKSFVPGNWLESISTWFAFVPVVARGLVPRSGGVAQCQGRWNPAKAGMTATGSAMGLIPGKWLEPVSTWFAYSPVVARGLCPPLLSGKGQQPSRRRFSLQ